MDRKKTVWRWNAKGGAICAADIQHLNTTPLLPHSLFRAERWAPLGFPEDWCWTLKNFLSKWLDFAINFREYYLIGNIKSDWMCAFSASCFHLLWLVLSLDMGHPSFFFMIHADLVVPKHGVVPEHQLWCLEWNGIKIYPWNNGSDNVILLFAVMTCIHFNGISNQEH